MEIAVMQARVLAEAPPRVWIAVSGTLAAPARHRLHQTLRACADQGFSELFLDLRRLRYADVHEARRGLTMFALGSGVRCHPVGAPAEFRDHLADDPRITLHSALESAWRDWE
ncbi:hypothetical protein N4P33_31205 [Streptomyces sp. 15-116A]|uniref:hypothetical protein n=1 Tax=Streptomyces sp. 15-116A TaxID=2259035 RepID=UPI0021B2107D|nr:hypothetical protein [Streptomyces sp. 15-116A]MCT7356580.1 hypothetical protein [Streptomyces sp. 15-116A]